MYSLKFGGTSMGNAKSIQQVADIILSHEVKEKTVTVSAMSGVTDMLIQASQCATKQNNGCFKSILQDIEEKHLVTLNQLIVHNKDLYKEGETFIVDRVQAMKEFLEAIMIIGELSPRSYDAVVSLGEILSAFLLSLHLQDRGQKSTFINLERIITQEYEEIGKEFFEDFSSHLSQKLTPLLQEGDIPVITGFFGRIPGGIVNAVGRGYSDFTAALVGKACQAEEIQIWTDVSGILSTDPRIVPNAHVLPELSFDEASELANFGAKVIHPQTIWPAVKKNILVRIKNTMNPSAPGTAITKKGKGTNQKIKAVTLKKGITILTITSKNTMDHNLVQRIFEIFTKHSVSIALIATSEISMSVTIDSGHQNIKKLITRLEQCSKVKLEENKSIITIVGKEMKNEIGVLSLFVTALSNANINVRMVSQGASELNISAVIDEKDSNIGIESTHCAFFGK